MSDEKSLAHVQPTAIMSMEEALQRRNAIAAFVNERVLIEGIDYGKVPGSDKNTLLKPGAEKLATFFYLSPRFTVLDKILDFECGIFYFQYACELTRDGVYMGMGIGSCNSHETKYRWRKAERTCPQCGQAAIIKGKPEYGGGWVCYKKKGGCGAKFPDQQPEIIGQTVGRIPNPDPADQLNTIDKMAQKRALVAAVIITVNASEFFTQDIEEWAEDYVESTYAVVSPEPLSAAVQSELLTPAGGNSHSPATNGSMQKGPAPGEWHKRPVVMRAGREAGLAGEHIINRLKKAEREGIIRWADDDAEVIRFLKDPDAYQRLPEEALEPGREQAVLLETTSAGMPD